MSRTAQARGILRPLAVIATVGGLGWLTTGIVGVHEANLTETWAQVLALVVLVLAKAYKAAPDQDRDGIPDFIEKVGARLNWLVVIPPLILVVGCGGKQDPLFQWHGGAVETSGVASVDAVGFDGEAALRAFGTASAAYVVVDGAAVVEIDPDTLEMSATVDVEVPGWAGVETKLTCVWPYRASQAVICEFCLRGDEQPQCWEIGNVREEQAQERTTQVHPARGSATSQGAYQRNPGDRPDCFSRGAGGGRCRGYTSIQPLCGPPGPGDAPP